MVDSWWLTMAADGGTSNSRSPDEGELNIGEIPISLATQEYYGSLSQDHKHGKCFPKASMIPSMVVKYVNLRDRI